MLLLPFWLLGLCVVAVGATEGGYIGRTSSSVGVAFAAVYLEASASGMLESGEEAIFSGGGGMNEVDSLR